MKTSGTAAAGLEVEVAGDRHGHPLVGDDELGEPAPADDPEDPVADPERPGGVRADLRRPRPRIRARGCRRGRPAGRDTAPGLEEVGPVQPAGADPDADLIAPGLGRGDLADLHRAEVAGPGDDDGFHGSVPGRAGSSRLGVFRAALGGLGSLCGRPGLRLAGCGSGRAGPASAPRGGCPLRADQGGLALEGRAERLVGLGVGRRGDAGPGPGACGPGRRAAIGDRGSSSRWGRCSSGRTFAGIRAWASIRARSCPTLLDLGLAAGHLDPVLLGDRVEPVVGLGVRGPLVQGLDQPEVPDVLAPAPALLDQGTLALEGRGGSGRRFSSRSR